MLLKTLLNHNLWLKNVPAKLIQRQCSGKVNETLKLVQSLSRHLDTVKEDKFPKAKYFRIKEIQEQIVELSSSYEDLTAEIESSNKEDKSWIEELVKDRQEKEANLEKLLFLSSKLLMPQFDFDDSNAILEIKAGAGGLEAGVFAGEILNLYLGYINYLGFESHVFEEIEIPVGKMTSNLSKPIALTKVMVKGENVFGALKYECGVHRVQRVPITGTKSDRLQTSTCSVAVYPRPEMDEIHIDPKDIKIRFVKSSGAGGQNVQKNDTCCVLTYLPLGEVFKVQEERTAKQNQEIAMKKLKEHRFNDSYVATMNRLKKMRKSQIGNMDRNEKIRSYNYNRHEMSDHRVNDVVKVQDISAFLKGSFGYEIVDKLHDKHEHIEALEMLKSLLEDSE